MYTTDIHYRKVFAALLFGIVCVSAAYASPCPNCSKWEGQTFHDAQVTKGGRCKMGTIPKGCIPTFNKSEDFCLRCRVIVPYNTPSGYRRCPKCFGKGEIPDKIENPKEVSKPNDSNDTKTAQKETEDKPDGGQKVVLVGVKKCDACDENGKIIPNIECDLCENGFNHKKDGTAFKCRVCGKVCASRFAACCKPDCPACGSKRDVKIDCPLCGGDKVITPLEEAKNKERVVPADTKQ
jgi:hypothetical protein